MFMEEMDLDIDGLDSGEDVPEGPAALPSVTALSGM